MSPPNLDDRIRSHLETLQALPWDEEAFQSLETLFEENDRWEELVRLYEGRARVLSDSALAASLIARAADLARNKLKDTEWAEALCLQLLRLEPKNAGALKSLAELHEERGAYAALADVLEQQAESAGDPEQTAALYFRLGRLFEEKLLRRDRAALFFGKACRAAPSFSDARAHALAAMTELHRYSQAKGLLDSARDAGVDRKVLAAEYAKLGSLLVDEPLEHGLAMDVLFEARELDRSAEGVTEALERLKALPRTWREYAKTLRETAGKTQERGMAARLMLRLAQLHATYDPDSGPRVQEYAEKAWQLAPGTSSILDFVERYHREHEDWRALSEQMERFIVSTRDRTAVVAAQLRLAQVSLIRFGDQAAALTALERALDLDPSDVTAALQAFELQSEAGQFDRALTTLERHLAVAPARPQQASLRVRAAEIALNRLSDKPRARRHLEAALRLDRGQAAAATLLAPMLREEKEWKRLVEVLDVRAVADRDPAEQVRAFEALAEIQRDQLDRPREALGALARALQIDPRRAATRKAMEAVAARAGAFVELSRAYRAAAEIAKDDPKTKKLLLRRVAEILERDLDQPGEAVRVYRTLVELDPEDKTAENALAACLARAGQHADLVEVLRKQMADAEPSKWRDVAAKLAQLYQEASEQTKAAEVWREVLARHENDNEALEGLTQALAGMGPQGSQELLSVLERRFGRATSDAERTQITLRRALLLSGLGKLEESAALFLDLLRVTGLSQAQLAEVVLGLESLLARKVDPLRIAQALAPVYASTGEPAKHVVMLELVAERLPAGSDSRERARYYLDSATIRAEKLADPRGALTAAAAALRACPNHADARQRCEELALKVGAYAELYALFAEIAGRLAEEPESERLVRLRAAQLAEEDLGRGEEAALQLRRCLEITPYDSEVLAALTRVALAGERWEEACDLLLQRARRAEGPERIALLGQLAQTLLERMHSPSAAVDVYRQALDLALPEQRPRLLGLLAQALELAGDPVGQAHALEELAAQSSDPQEFSRATVQRARIQEERLGDRSGAIDNYCAALARNPQDAIAVTALEPVIDDADSGLASKAAQALVPVYEKSGESRKLAKALTVLARQAKEPGERATIFRRIANIWLDKMKEPGSAFAALADAARAVPTDEDVRQELRSAAEEGHLGEDCARVYDELLTAVQGESAVPLRREAAELCEKQLGAHDRATNHQRALLELKPSDLDALSALRRLARSAERWGELYSVCLELAGMVADGRERIELLREAAAVSEGKLVEPEKAAAAWRKLAEADATDTEALAALDRLYEALDRPADLAWTLQRRRSLAGGDRDLDMAGRLAEIHRKRLDAPAESLALHTEILRADPTRSASRDALVELAAAPGPVGREALVAADAALRGSGEHGRRIEARELRLSAVEDPVERARLFADIRGLLERDLGEPDRAFMAACRAFSEGGQARVEAMADLPRLATLTHSFEELAEVYEGAAAVSSGTEAIELYRQAARTWEQSQAGSAGAVAAWRKVLDAATTDDAEALDALERLYRTEKSARELAEVTRRRAMASQGAERHKHLLRLGALQAESLGDLSAAAAVYEEALAIDPESVPALEALEPVYREQKRSDDLARVLATLAQLEPTRRNELLLRRAAILEEAADVKKPIEAYAEILAENPQEPGAVAGLERLLKRPDSRIQAARLLEDVYRMSGDARRMVSLLELRLEDADSAERAPLLAETAALHERLGQRQQAFIAKRLQYRETLAGGSDQPSVRADLERLAAETGSFDDLAATFEEALEKGVSGPASLEILWRLASVQADHLSNLDQAARCLEKVASTAPGVEVFGALARIYRRQNAFRELAGVYRRQAEFAPTIEAKKDLLLEVATIMDEHLSDQDGAVEAYRQIVSIDPEDPNALRLLGRLLGAKERWDELAEILAREVNIAERRPNFVAEAAELKYRLGRIRQQRLKDGSGALQCFKDVLAKVPRHPAALAAIEELTRSSGPVSAEAADIVEPIYLKEGEYEKLVDTLKARVTTITDPVERAALLRRVAAVYVGPLRSPDMAFIAAAQAVREYPDGLESVDLATEVAQAAGVEEELASLLADNGDRTRDAAVRAEYRRRAARLHIRIGSEPQRVAEAWQQLIDLVPDDAEALAGLTDVHRKAGSGESLAQLLRRRIVIEDDSEKRAVLLVELAQVQEEKLKDPAGAIATLKRLLDMHPQQREALARLDRLCVRSEKWVELADILAREVTAADVAGDTAAALVFRFRLAELKETRLLDREGALGLYEEVLAARPDHAETIARLEALIQKDPGLSRAATSLERAYEAGGAWPKFAAILEMRAGDRPDSVERKALFVRLAQIREKKLGNPELAFLALCRAFRDDPADAALRADLERLADATEHQEELAAIYEDECDRLDPTSLLGVATKLGALYEGSLAVPDRAAAFYEKARSLDPNAPGPLAALDRIYRKLEAWPELADVLKAEADREPGKDERSALLFRLGQLSEERLSDLDRAGMAYEAILVIDPKHAPALRALERIYEAANRDESLFDNLAAQKQIATDASARERISTKMAALAGTLGRDEDAITLWREALGIRPKHEQALAALEGLYEKLERWPDLAEALRMRLAVTVDRREITRLNDRLGWLLGTKLGNAAQAAQSFKAVLDSDPRNRRALEALRDIYTTQGDSEGLIGIYRRLIPLQEDAAGVKEVRLRLAEVLLAANHKQESADQARLAFKLEPHSAQDLGRFEEVFKNAGAPADGVRASEARAALLASEGRLPDAIAAYFSVAELWHKGLKKHEGAAAALEKVLEIEPNNREAYERLREVYSEAGNWRAFTRVCDHFAPQVADPEEKLALLKEVAQIQEKKLGQKEMAFLGWCRAFQEAPADAEAIQEVQRLAGETEAFDELCDVYEQVAEDAQGPLRAHILLQLGRIRDVNLDDIEGAENAFRRAIELDPGSTAAIDGLTSLFKRRGRTRDLVIALEQKLEAAAGLDEKKATLIEVAKIYDEDLGDTDEAIVSLKRVLELDGADPAGIEALSSLYRRGQHWNDLAGVLARARDLAPDDAARVGYQLQIASLYENEIADEEAAVEAYRSVLGLNDQEPEALAGLERLYTKLDRFAELNRIYEKQAELATDAREKARILAKSAGIWEEKLQTPLRAIERNEQILQLDGGNLPAVKSLERLYKQEGLWEKFISVTQHHVSLIQDRREIVSLEVAAGEIWYKELSRVDRAEAIFNHAIQLEPNSREAVSALGRLYERSGNWNLALDMLRREARLTGASRDTVEIFTRMGKIQEDMIMDMAAAKDAYGRALDLDPGYLPAIRALKGLHERAGDRDAYLECLNAESRYAVDEEEKTQLLFELGRLYQDERDDRENATRYYEEALKHTPDFLPAAKPLSDIYIARTEWERAEAILDVVVKRLNVDGDPKDLCRQAYRLGYVAEKRARREKALVCYRRAYELDATYLPALEGLGNLLVQNQGWEEAQRIFEAILIHHQNSLTDLELVETNWQLGEIKAKLGAPERAVNSFRKALEIDANHEPSRRSLVRLHEEMGDWDSAVEQRQKLLSMLDGKAKFDMFLAIGEACRDKLKDPYQAIDAFSGASKIDPGSLAVTEGLLGLYRETRQGQKAADVLGQLLAIPEVQADTARAAKLEYSLGEILRDEVKDEDASVAAFERALDKDPRMVQAFSAVETMLTQSKKWQALEQAYRRMVQRLPKGQETTQARIALWKTLGELYRRVLNDPEGARTAYGVVAKADPEDAAALEIYAELAAAVSGQEAEAIGAYRQLLKVGTATPQKALNTLVGLHVARKEYDKAYNSAQVLAFLAGGGTGEEQQVITKLRRYARDAASRALNDRLWQTHVLHEKARGPLADIMTILATQTGSLFVQNFKTLELNPKKDEIDLEGSMLFFVNMFKYVARTLGAGALRLFKDELRPSRLAFVSTDPPGLVAGDELFRDRPKKELWFAIAKAMAFYRPELKMARLMPQHDQLDQVFQAACSVGTSKFVVTADPHAVEKYKRQLERALPEQIRMNALKKVAREYCVVQHPGDVRAYMDGAELTSNRVGALLAGDLDVVNQSVLSEKAQVSKLREDARLRDLMFFCASEEYAQLREQLGLSAVVTG